MKQAWLGRTGTNPLPPHPSLRLNPFVGMLDDKSQRVCPRPSQLSGAPAECTVFRGRHYHPEPRRLNTRNAHGEDTLAMGGNRSQIHSILADSSVGSIHGHLRTHLYRDAFDRLAQPRRAAAAPASLTNYYDEGLSSTANRGEPD